MKLIAWLKRFLLSRFFLLLVILSLQIFLLISGVRFLFEYPVTEVVITIVNLLLTVYVVNRDENTSYKLAWILLIYAIPVFGSVIYLLFAEKRVPATLRADMIRYLSETDDVLFQKKKVQEALTDPDLVQQFDYVHENSYFPYYQNTDCFYFGDGEAYFNDLIEKIGEAKHFVFLEFFIVKDGSMLESLVAVLRKKVAEGVQVYFMYDDGGSVTTLSRDYKKVLSNYGIHCTAFNPVKISLTLLSKTSNRDHRKICVIDNTVAYVGGLNIGDEYINKEVRFGHWKDSALRVEGEAVRSLTVMFIQFYNANAEHPLRYEDYLLPHRYPKNTSFVLPFSDSPTDEENVCRTVHFNLIIFFIHLETHNCYRYAIHTYTAFQDHLFSVPS